MMNLCIRRAENRKPGFRNWLRMNEDHVTIINGVIMTSKITQLG